MANVINIPESLAHELDQLAEAERKQTSTYVVEVLWKDVQRNKQRQALKKSSGAWNLAEHPELAQGGAAYVEKIRAEPDERFDDAIRENQTP